MRKSTLIQLTDFLLHLIVMQKDANNRKHR